MAYGMLFDLEKCTGCQACTMACKDANATPPGVFRAHVERVTEGVYPDVQAVIHPMLCMQCNAPACMAACSVGAIEKDDDTGVVTTDLSKCIGCKACVSACPYGARYYVDTTTGYFENLTEYEQARYPEKVNGTVDKCDFCSVRDHQPACVAACPSDARIFGTLEELQPIIDERGGFQLLPEEGTDPCVWYLPRLDS